MIRESFPQELLKTLILEEALVLYFLVFIVILSYLGHNLIIDCPQTESFVEKLIGEPTFSLRYFKAIKYLCPQVINKMLPDSVGEDLVIDWLTEVEGGFSRKKFF